METLPASTAKEPAAPGPPRIVLTSAAGRQEAVAGSFCVSSATEGTCGDSGPIDPLQLSVVRPGERVEVFLEDAQVTEGSVRVLPLGCQAGVSRLRLEPGPLTHWRVVLDAGAYELDVFARFQGPSTSGDVSGSLGLLVDPDRMPAILPARDSLRACLQG